MGCDIHAHIETTITDEAARAIKYGVPPALIEALERYAKLRLYPGEFLEAVLKNDLISAVYLGDSATISALLEIVSYCVQVLPKESWKSPQKVTAWLGEAA